MQQCWPNIALHCISVLLEMKRDLGSQTVLLRSDQVNPATDIWSLGTLARSVRANLFYVRHEKIKQLAERKPWEKPDWRRLCYPILQANVTRPRDTCILGYTKRRWPVSCKIYVVLYLKGISVQSPLSLSWQLGGELNCVTLCRNEHVVFHI